MKIAFITAGAAGMYCGSCMKDNTLAAALTRAGHDALLIPTYTPIRTDEEDVSQRRIFFGGINVYLQQKRRLCRHTPWLFDRLLDFPRLLRWVSRFAVKTTPDQLGDMTISMLEGRGGKQRSVGLGVTERDEMETPWSAEAHARCLDILASRGIALRRVAPVADPVATLLAAGLSRVQERETHRRLRHAAGGVGAPVAELAVDEVTFHLDAGAIRHHEVEIEAKASGGADYLPLAAAELRASFPSALAPWRPGKLATGFAIARLLASPEGAGMVADGHLIPAAYPRLAALLSAETIAPPE